jgi:hypothetical protein
MRRLLATHLVGYSVVAVLFLVLGHMLAATSLRQEVWVDYHSGARKTTCSLYPFAISTELRSDAFWTVFGRSPDQDVDWVKIDCRHLIPSLDQEAISEGEALVRAENQFVVVLLRDEAVSGRVAVLSDGFYDALRSHGVDGVSHYAKRLFFPPELHGTEEGTSKAPIKTGKATL